MVQLIIVCNVCEKNGNEQLSTAALCKCEWTASYINRAWPTFFWQAKETVQKKQRKLRFSTNSDSDLKFSPMVFFPSVKWTEAYFCLFRVEYSTTGMGTDTRYWYTPNRKHLSENPDRTEMRGINGSATITTHTVHMKRREPLVPSFVHIPWYQ